MVIHMSNVISFKKKQKEKLYNRIKSKTIVPVRDYFQNRRDTIVLYIYIISAITLFAYILSLFFI